MKGHAMQRRRKQKVLGMTEIFVKDAIKLWTEDNKAKNLSRETMSTYKLHMNDFIKRMEIEDLCCTLLGIDLYNWYIEDLQEEGTKADSTIASYCRTIRVFYYWCMDNEYTPNLSIKLPKYQKTIKVTYTADELSVLLEKPLKDCSEVEYLSWVFINICISTGLRLSSVLGLKVYDYNKKEKTLVVNNTKNNIAKLIYLNDEMCTILNKYISLFELSETDWFFATGEGTQLKRRSIQDYVAKYNRRRGVEKTSIHLFRHTFAKNYYERTKDIYALCNILGHSTISTTENYLRDLGLTSETSTAFNPQLEFVKKNKQKRRGKIKH